MRPIKWSRIWRGIQPWGCHWGQRTSAQVILFFPSKIVKNGNISKKDLLTKKMEMRFVILALPEYPEVCLMIAKLFVHSDLRNDHCVSFSEYKHEAIKNWKRLVYGELEIRVKFRTSETYISCILFHILMYYLDVSFNGRCLGIWSLVKCTDYIWILNKFYKWR